MVLCSVCTASGVVFFSFPHSAPPASRLGVRKKLGGDTARTADPERCSMPCGIVLSTKTSGKGGGKEDVCV